MSVQALSCAFAIRGIGSSEKLVLLALANFADDKMVCWPSQERLALDTELGERTVWSALRSLEARGLLSREKRNRPDGTRSSDRFTLHFALTIHSEPVANLAKPTRKSCETQSQILHEPVAAVATLTTFEPSLEEPKEERADAPAPVRASRSPSKFVPADFEPSPHHRAKAETMGLTAGDFERALSRFRNHEYPRPYSDFSRCFTNWLDRETASNAKSTRLAAKESNLARGWAGADRAVEVLASRRAF